MHSGYRLKQTEIGTIPEEWGIASFDKVISHIVDNRGKTAPTVENGIALIATNCIKEEGLFPVKEKVRYVSEETYNNWFRDPPKPDDIIIVNKGTPGQVCLVPKLVDFCIAHKTWLPYVQTQIIIYSRFLFAFMKVEDFQARSRFT
jgi:type I restriction enzyme S subunit